MKVLIISGTHRILWLTNRKYCTRNMNLDGKGVRSTVNRDTPIMYSITLPLPSFISSVPFYYSRNATRTKRFYIIVGISKLYYFKPGNTIIKVLKKCNSKVVLLVE
jgi:hypothetical protein